MKVYFLTLIAIEGALALTVDFKVVPPVAKINATVQVICDHDLKGGDLYSLKYYKDNDEFYRYTPSNQPPVMQFPLNGINLQLQDNTSDHKMLILSDVNLSHAGEYSCEVSGEAPTFLALRKHQYLQVVYIPKGHPHLVTKKIFYGPGETMNATCTSRPSHPATALQFLINNATVAAHVDVITYQNNLKVTKASLLVQLNASDSHDHELQLTCLSRLSDFHKSAVTLYFNSTKSHLEPHA